MPRSTIATNPSTSRSTVTKLFTASNPATYDESGLTYDDTTIDWDGTTIDGPADRSTIATNPTVSRSTVATNPSASRSTIATNPSTTRSTIS